MSALLTLLSALTPAWLKAALSCAGAVAGVGLYAWLKGKSTQAQVASQKNDEAQAIVANHAVEEQAQAAITDEEAYAALNADRQSDHR